MELRPESGAAPGERKKKGAGSGNHERAKEKPEDEGQVVQPRPPQGWPRRLLFFFPAALFIFLIGVLLWGILSDLLAGYR